MYDSRSLRKDNTHTPGSRSAASTHSKRGKSALNPSPCNASVITASGLCHSSVALYTPLGAAVEGTRPLLYGIWKKIVERGHAWGLLKHPLKQNKELHIESETAKHIPT